MLSKSSRPQQLSDVNSTFKVGSGSIAITKSLSVVTAITLRKCFFSPSVTYQRPPQIPGKMNPLIDNIGGELKLVWHTDQVLERALHTAAAILPSRLVLAGHF